MTFNLNATSSTVAIVGAVSVGGTPTTQVLYSANTATSNGTTTLATITAGKTAYILGWYINGNVGAASGTSQGQIKFDTAVADSVWLSLGATTSSTTGGHSVMLPSGYYIPLAATKTITLVVSGTSNSNNTWSAGVYYIEV